MKTARKIIFLFFAALLFANVPSAFSQAVINQVFITSVDYSQFPNISARMRVVGENRMPIGNLKAEDLMVTEDGTPVQFSLERVRVGVKVAVVMDMGAGLQHDGATHISQFEEMRSIVKGFLDTMDEKDGVELITVYGNSTSVLVPMTSDKNVLVNAIDGLEFTPTQTLSNGLDGVMRAMEDLSKATGDSTPLAVLLITPGIQSKFNGKRTQYEDVSRLLESVDIPIHTILLVRGGQQTQLLEDLVAKSQGQFVRYTTRDSANSVFSLIDAQRWQYQITYRTTSGTGNERLLKVAARTEMSAPPFDVAKFTVVPAPQPPTVLSITINNGDPVTRKAPSYDSDLTEIPLTEVGIDVQIYWPDGYSQRKIARAELFIDGQPHDEPLLDLEDVDAISFTWDLRTYTNKGKTTARIQVVLTDELGLQSVEEVQVPVEVFVPDKPMPAPIVVPGTDICKSLKSLPYAGESLYSACQKWGITPAQMLNMVIALAALVLVGVIWFKRETVLAASQAAGRRITETVRRVTERIGRGQAKPKAYLEAVRGLPEEDLKRYDIFGETPIGRDPNYSELVFDSPKISGKHCTLHLEGHRWTIEDEDSTNGTFVNGRRIPAFQPIPINDGDSIELAPVERGGIRFKFIVAENTDIGDYDDLEDFGGVDDERETDVRVTNPVPHQSYHEIDSEDEFADDSFDPSAQEF